MASQNKRVVVVYWKNKPEDPIEVFSSLKNFCLSYPEFNYNTLSNYLSKAKTPYETGHVRVERKNIFSHPKPRKIIPVVRKVKLVAVNDYELDLKYWLGRSAVERLGAVTFLVRQSVKRDERLDKTRVIKRKLKH